MCDFHHNHCHIEIDVMMANFDAKLCHWAFKPLPHNYMLENLAYFCRKPSFIYIYILQVDLVGNWLLYSISEEMSSNLTRFLNLFDKFFFWADQDSNPCTSCTCIMVLPCEAGVLTVLPSWDGRRKGPGLQGLTANPWCISFLYCKSIWLAIGYYIAYQRKWVVIWPDF